MRQDSSQGQKKEEPGQSAQSKKTPAIRQLLQLAFPNALGIGKGWKSLIVWLIIMTFGFTAIWSSLEQNSSYMLPWQIRVIAGTIACYAGLNAFANKLIANGAI